MNCWNNDCLNTLNSLRPQIIRLGLEVAGRDIHILHVDQLGRRLSKLFSPLILISTIWSHFPVNKCEHLLNIILGGGVRGCQEEPGGTSVPQGRAHLPIATIVPRDLGGRSLYKISSHH